MIGILFSSGATVFGVLLALTWAKGRFEEMELRQRLEMERIVLQLQCQLKSIGRPVIETMPLELGMTIEDPPVLSLPEAPAPLPVARVIKL